MNLVKVVDLAAESASKEAKEQADSTDDSQQNRLKDYGKLKVKVTELKAEVPKITTELDELVNEEKRVQLKVFESKSKVAKSEALVASLTKEKKNLEEDVQRLEAIAATKNTDMLLREQHFNERRKVQSSLISTQTALETELRHAERIAQAGEEDVQRLNDQAEAITHKTEELRKKYSELCSKVESKKQQFHMGKELQTKHYDIASSIEVEENKVAQYREQVKEFQRKLEECQGRRNDFECNARALLEHNKRRLSEKRRVSKAKSAETQYIWNKLEEALHIS